MEITRYSIILGIILSLVLWVIGFFYMLKLSFIPLIIIYLFFGGLLIFLDSSLLMLKKEIQRLKRAVYLSQRKYRNIAAHSDEAIAIYDLSGKVVEWNRRAEEVFGYKKHEIIGEEYPFREEIDRFRERLDHLKRGEIYKKEKIVRKVKNGDSKSLLLTTIPFFNGEREFIGFAEIATDITQWVEAQQAMLDVERMAVFSEIAPGLAHQLNTPLASIQLMAQMLQEEVANPEVKEEMMKIERQVSYCKSIVDKLMRLSRRPKTKRVPIILCDLIQELINFYARELERKNIKISYSFGPPGRCGGCMIKADPEELSHVFLNLFSNAMDAMPTGGEIRISCKKVGDQLSISFRDTGVGIPTNILSSIFDPFFTTKEAGKGTGLGLAIVKRIIEECSGDVKVRSRVGEGTEFIIRLPINFSMPEEENESEPKKLQDTYS